MLQYPFLRETFLDTLERSGSVHAATGWAPRHLRIERRGVTEAFMPLYLKDHSWGEYVFDWAWASAYQRYGLAYYPKLLTAIPFTPATGPRIRFAPGVDRGALTRQLVDDAIARAETDGASSWHLLFPDAETRDHLDDPRLLTRTGIQYHWFNRDYGDFEEFLAAMISRKRKMVRRERRGVAAQGLSVDILEGAGISPELWDFFYRLYQHTYLKRSGSGGYLTRDFFLQLGEVMPEQIMMAVAREGDEPVACALYFFDDETLYGRYWGCVREYDYLHFELCYYQGIDFAIRRGLARFDAGAQGEHKILRGFEPVLTRSLHWIAEPGFVEAIGRFVEEEAAHLARYQREARALLPYRESANT